MSRAVGDCPKVSVVVPVYNGEETIARALGSLVRQTYKNIEIIVFDNGSNDATSDVVKSFQAIYPNITCFRNCQTLKIGESWNTASQMAQGDYVKLVCADDSIHPDLISRQVELLELSGPTFGFVSSARETRVRVWGKELGIALSLKGGLREIHSGQLTRVLSRGKNLFGEPMATLFRRNVLEEIGFWQAKWPFFIDYATYLKALEAYSALLDGWCGSRFFVSGGQFSQTFSPRAQVKSFQELFRHFAPGEKGFLAKRAVLVFAARSIAKKVLSGIAD